MLYRTILIDPPWSYNQKLGRTDTGDKTRGGLPYSSMSIEEITQLPISQLADKDAMLWLWTTNSHIHEAFHIMANWGFQYKTMATWAKTNFGLGYWLRGQTEHLLLGVKGKPRSKYTGPKGATGNAWSTLIIAKRERHSKKPEKFMEMIESLSEKPRIELFAREQRPGWDVWGNEVESYVDVWNIGEKHGIQPVSMEND